LEWEESLLIKELKDNGMKPRGDFSPGEIAAPIDGFEYLQDE